MLAKFSIARELGDLIRDYVQTHQIQLPELERILSRRQPDKRMPITDWWAALELLRDFTQLPHIGLELGKTIAPAHAGSVGYLIQTSGNVLEALQTFHTSERMLYEGAISTLEVLGQQVRVEWPLDNGKSTRESNDTLMSAIVSLFRKASGKEGLAPSSLGFIHDLPRDINPYIDYFGCKPSFNCPCTYITFSLATCNTAIASADPMLHGILEEKVRYQLAEMPETEVFLRWFYQHLFALIRQGEPTVEAVAIRMNLSPRTLFRRLQEHNLHFKDVLMETRRLLAEKYLKEGKFTHTEIATLLGYSEQSAFSRAFKAWTGLTPRQYQCES